MDRKPRRQIPQVVDLESSELSSSVEYAELANVSITDQNNPFGNGPEFIDGHIHDEFLTSVMKSGSHEPSSQSRRISAVRSSIKLLPSSPVLDGLGPPGSWS